MTRMKSSLWWGSERDTLRRVLADQLFAELERLRIRNPGILPPWMWTGETTLDEFGPAAIDSLDMLSMTSAVVELLPDVTITGLMQAKHLDEWCSIIVENIYNPPREIIFRSSGSTGVPKRATHTLDHLKEEASVFATLIGAGRHRVMSAIPAHHVYGFIHSVLLPQSLGHLPVIDLRGNAPANLGTMLQPGDLVLGHPVFWDAVLRGINGFFPIDVIGITSGAPCSAETALGLGERGLARLLQVYGSSETTGVGWRDDPHGAYNLLPAWRHEGDGIAKDQLTFPIPDFLSWEGDRQFHLLGRKDGAVQIGGVNVLVEDICRALVQHPSVADIAVRPMRPDEGTRLKAFIVPADMSLDLDELQADLRRFASTILNPAERPAVYTFGPSLPRSDQNKLVDWFVQ